MRALPIAKIAGIMLYFLLYVVPVAAANDEIEVLRQRLIQDALEEKGFLIRTERYISSDFSKTAEYLHSLQANGAWTDVDYADQDNEWNPLVALDRILIMTYAYSHPEDKLHQDAALKSGIVNALQYWYQVNPHCINWYKNVIAKQFYFNVIALLLQGHIEEALLDKMINDLTEAPSMTGSNRTLVSVSVLYRGVLERNAARISSGVAGIMKQVHITPEEGIQQDYSFHQHGAFLYNGSYGHGFLKESIWLAYMVRDTQFAFTEEQMQVLRNYYLQGMRWMVHREVLDYNVRGRQVGRSSSFDPDADILVPQLEHFIIADSAYREAYQTSRQRILHQQPQAIQGNRHFWRSDYTAHHRDAYFTSLRMCSERTVGMEMDVNTENLYGYYLPYGLTYIYRRGDEYQEIFPVWDWARLPGVTSPHHAFSMKGRSTQSTSFVGGVSDSTYGISTMHLDVKDTQAKKSWFWFDQEWVALGTDIQSRNEHPIVTGINQCLLNGEVIVDGETVAEGERTLESPSWIWHDSIAYLFPEQQAVGLQATERSGQLQKIFGLGADSVYRKEIFSLWFDHGLQPTQSSYAYVVRPGCSPSEMTAYAEELPLSILSNSSEVQAVHHHQLNISSIVFHEAGHFKLHDELNVEVNHPCLVLVNHTSKKITVSDPTTRLNKIKVTLSTNEKKQETASVSLPEGQFAGSSVTINKVFLLLEKPDYDNSSGKE
ncbi:polysaccharide lyase 8 family protein [Catalinimonas niigatensis]|uniref:polysaccharide lyase 8 family protein n=1 Tax=Catalinimonas niigatensis TaxID=1397264 RepID=UPI002665FB97|nr:polysaccharide lyase 8 family protein [Catalinimonas niigatensis]WPP51433.1 polysaccharide lyase 8 family protein [Catalinimonas niigatensis]